MKGTVRPAMLRDTAHCYDIRTIRPAMLSDTESSELLCETSGYGCCDDPLLSPLTESEYSVISEVSTRADRTRSDVLEGFNAENNFEGYLRPLHRTTRASLSDDLYGEMEHIYEELDNYQSKTIDTPEESISSPTLKKDDISEDSDYAIMDLEEKTNETSDEVSKRDDEDLVYDDVQSRIRQETASSVPRSPIRIRKAHPDGLVFPKITSIVSILPNVPEEFELLPQILNGEDVASTHIPYADESSQISGDQIPLADLMTTRDDSNLAVIKTSTKVTADQHRLVIKGWETLISDSDDSS
ncbi:hypothetical protein KIN20_027840 [Parelaphostrongylus tenuis]|uniref:Uncharacterized protein n=1 Tax=Parelaphostrongylus tenuis TaxID=148309 RepID=A0AAD5WEA1_PARTN|nr:hypothetical protein KIN20_027840 [Parelaphostrongylus tenuis]